MSYTLPSIKNRKDFLKISNEGLASPQCGLVLQAAINNNNEVRIGITATKKIGNAVIRNKCKRKLKNLANEILLNYAQKKNDYVLIARNSTYDREMSLLKKDLIKALKDINKYKKK
tara:strand:- start:39532 stop:39879 length:348 start_codon:yes stop_codon:yes gene_type:complete